MIDASDTFYSLMKKTICQQKYRFDFIYIAMDKCLEGRQQIHGDVLITVLAIVFTDDFFPAHVQESRHEFIFFYVAQLIAGGIFSHKGKDGKILSFEVGENDAADLRREAKESVKKHVEPEKLEKWLDHVARIYSEGEAEHAMRDKKESTLN